MVADARHRRRGIDLSRFCRQYMHRICSFGARCRYDHVSYCLTYASTGRCKRDRRGRCDFVHADVCEHWKNGRACPLNPTCPYLHITLPGGPPQPLQVQLVPRAPEDPEQLLDQDPEEVSLEPEESQLTAGAAARFGYLGFGDSDVENDTDGEHSEDLAEVREEPPEREPAAARRRAAKPPQRSTTEVAAQYRPHAPVTRRELEGRKRRPLKMKGEKDTNVRHRWMVTCRRCKKQIMTVFNHRVIAKSVFKNRALRGYWLRQANGQLFGRVGLQGTQKRLSCQKSLPGPDHWDVSRASDRRLERRILKGQLLKHQFQFHAGEECAPNAPEMRFEEQCGLKRRMDGVKAADEGGYDGEALALDDDL
ncbi:unnamed protein product [Symbiodinium necroappetens]|uniref:C3H1-type domain-containing protein n=1 Tax=Symbiodinium necroappetens TaxID=1628268 RepID=A0A813ALV5_9DINO|nr:unnamed protein product [Symbiodinium necroappetens]